MKNITKTEIALIIALVLTTIGSVISYVSCITKGTPMTFMSQAIIIYAVLTLAFCSIDKKKKAAKLEAENK